MTLRISSSQTCKCQSLKRAGVKATLHQPANGGASPCANVLKAITGSGYQPAMRGALPCCKCSRNHVTGPCGPSLVLATSQLCEQPFLALDVLGTHATATFSKRRLLLLLLLLILITGVNAGAYEIAPR